MAANKLLEYQTKKSTAELNPTQNTTKLSVKTAFQKTTAKNRILGLKGMTSW